MYSSGSPASPSRVTSIPSWSSLMLRAKATSSSTSRLRSDSSSALSDGARALPARRKSRIQNSSRRFGCPSSAAASGVSEKAFTARYRSSRKGSPTFHLAICSSATWPASRTSASGWT